MNVSSFPAGSRVRFWGPIGVGALAIAAAGYGVGSWHGHPAPTPAAAPQDQGRKVLYWYDPMVPTQHFDKPGKSPFMDMQLVAKYADGDSDASGGGVRIDPTLAQNFGVRTAVAHRGVIGGAVRATGVIGFNQREVAIVQPRASGFVQRTYGRAPDDVIPAGAPIADVLVPEWGGAQEEYLAALRTGDGALAQAARQRMLLLGMPPGTADAVARQRRTRTVYTITSPIGGAITTLGVRPGMTVSAGQSLAEVNGLGSVWLDAAVPEAQVGAIRPGQPVTATLTAFPGESFSGKVQTIVPQADSQSRTLTVRIELPNRGAKLRPGMFAQVAFGGEAQAALLVPSEAVIATGRRSIVMLALDKGRYRPAEVKAGRTVDGETEILAGLSDGEKVITSGQFLIDSEASLAGMDVRPLNAAPVPAMGAMQMPPAPAGRDAR